MKKDVSFDDAVSVSFRDLSNSLKVAVVLAYVSGSIFVLAFVVGFISGLLDIGVTP
jgi:hypothetical protein